MHHATITTHHPAITMHHATITTRHPAITMHHATITTHHATTTMHHATTTLASFPRAPAHFHLQITVVTSSFRCWSPHTCLLTLMGASWGQRPHLTCSNLLVELCWKVLLTFQGWRIWWERTCMHFSCVWLFVTPWTVTHLAPLSMGFSRQEFWSGLPCLPSRDLPKLGIQLMSRQMGSLLLAPTGKPMGENISSLKVLETIGTFIL